MLAERLIYLFIIYAYALSLFFSLADLLAPDGRKARWGCILHVVVWLAQTAFLLVRILVNFPLFASYDALFFYSWVLVTFSLVLHLYLRIDLFVFFANLIGFIVLSLSLFTVQHVSVDQAELLLSELVFIHVTMAILAYAFFSLSTLFAVLFLIGNHLLKKKKWNRTLRRLPSLGRIQTFGHWLAIAGVVFLVLSLILGSIWAYQQVGSDFWQDSKVYGSLLVLIAYLFQLRRLNSWSGPSRARLSIVAFMTIPLNILLFGAGTSFHQWQ